MSCVENERRNKCYNTTRHDKTSSKGERIHSAGYPSSIWKQETGNKGTATANGWVAGFFGWEGQEKERGMLEGERSKDSSDMNNSILISYVVVRC